MAPYVNSASSTLIFGWAHGTMRECLDFFYNLVSCHEPMRISVITKYFAGVVVGLALLITASGYFLLNSMCSNKTISEAKSPDGSLVAVVFQRDCGATTGFSTQVSIFRSWLPRWNNSGNIFVSDTNHGAAPSAPSGGPEVRVHWQAPNVLVVFHHPRAQVYSAQPQWGSVRVIYENLAQ